jgi:hypothetical protein
MRVSLVSVTFEYSPPLIPVLVVPFLDLEEVFGGERFYPTKEPVDQRDLLGRRAVCRTIGQLLDAILLAARGTVVDPIGAA